ncbi:hypothetical protein [Agromyces sp. SYSU T00194]|uniref:hypothetical protein n=1 Tax=Agromyces chitinivorans TaxID=3158560 RepID=UPI00339B3168
MVRRFCLLVGAFALGILLALQPLPAFACSAFDLAGGICTVRPDVVDGKQVDIWASIGAETPGNPLEDSNSAEGNYSGSTNNEPSNAEPGRPWGIIVEGLNVVPPPCWPEPECPAGEEAAGYVVTLADIASFRPVAPGDVMEPDGWAIVGLPANFVAGASAHVVSGVLLGAPADVRFTPVGHRWAHSDGGVVGDAAGGATWAALGQPEFSATPTSHVYAARGTYEVELTVTYAAEYRFAGAGWVPIAGTLDIGSGPRDVLVGAADTVLVGADCVSDPNGPGC